MISSYLSLFAPLFQSLPSMWSARRWSAKPTNKHTKTVVSIHKQQWLSTCLSSLHFFAVL